MSPQSNSNSHTLDPDEIKKFGAIADEWWDPTGKFAPLHKIGPARLAFFREQICRHFGRDVKAPDTLNGLTLIDVGCGGGLIAEPMAKQGATVTGIDPAENNIKAANIHADQSEISIDYRCCRAEDIVESGEKFDVVMLLEVVEHVPSLEPFVKLVSSLVAPGGLLILSTINRTTKSYAFAIIGAEYILRWLPRGTHQWNRFVTPDELKSAVSAAGLTPRETAGLVFNPLTSNWSIKQDCDVNYFLTATRPDD